MQACWEPLQAWCGQPWIVRGQKGRKWAPGERGEREEREKDEGAAATNSYTPVGQDYIIPEAHGRPLTVSPW